MTDSIGQTYVAVPDYPPVWRAVWRNHNRMSLLICTRKQAEAGKVIAKSVKIPHEGVIGKKDSW